MKFVVIFLVVVLAAVEAQLQLTGGNAFGPRVVRPYVITPNVKKYTAVNRQYTSSNSGSTDGQYKSDNSGAYNANDGQYYSDNSGAYVHQDNKYTHQDEQYKHAADKFGGSGGGGGSGGQYRDSAYNDGARLNSGLAKVSPGSGLKSGLGNKAPVAHGISSGSVYSGVKSEGQKSFGAAGYGEAVTLQQGSAEGKYDNRNYGIIRQTGKVEEDGYQYLYETENGILAEEQGKLANSGTDNEAMHATGFYTYTGPDAIVYTVNYVADENGFQPDAAHLPTPPPVPAYILRALDYQRSIGTLID